MASPDTNPQQVLQEEILADAKRQADRILRRARQEADGIRAKAEEEAKQERERRKEEGQREGVRRRELILATVPVEAGRMRAARVEELLESVREEARKQITASGGPDRRRDLIVLAAEAMKQMNGDSFVLQLPAAAGAGGLTPGEIEELRQRTGRPQLQVQPPEQSDPEADKLIIRDPDGRQIWDNTPTRRLERLWPLLRREVAARTGLLAQSGAAEGKQ